MCIYIKQEQHTTAKRKCSRIYGKVDRMERECVPWPICRIGEIGWRTDSFLTENKAEKIMGQFDWKFVPCHSAPRCAIPMQAEYKKISTHIYTRKRFDSQYSVVLPPLLRHFQQKERKIQKNSLEWQHQQLWKKNSHLRALSFQSMNKRVHFFSFRRCIFDIFLSDGD